MTDIDLYDWQQLIYRFKASNADKNPGVPCAMRCENSQLSIARHYGGITYNGERYTFFAPPIPGEKNDDGTQKRAWLVVRDDFLRWAVRELKEGATA